MVRSSGRHGFRKQRLVAITSHPMLIEHKVVSAHWTLPPLTIAVVSDLHVCRPWVSLAALSRIVGLTNALGADLVLLPGDFIASRTLPGRRENMSAIARVLSDLRAPLGVFAVMGNHDWWDCDLARASGFKASSVADGLAEFGIPLLSNRAERLQTADGGFWIVGMDSQRPLQGRPRHGFHDPDKAFAEVDVTEAAILLAHEPDFFAEGDARAFLQISGHTHGGQMNLARWRPMTPSVYGSKYAWGHMRDGERHLIVSGGIGYSGLPLRLFQPPEITLVTISGAG